MIAHTLIRVRYNVDRPNDSTIETNADADALRMLLESFLQSVSGADDDARESVMQDRYTVTIGATADDEPYLVAGDTCDKGLISGILEDTLGRLKVLTISSLQTSA